MKKFLPLVAITAILLLGLPAATLAWDGVWTEAESGRGDVIDYPNSSHSDAGTPERPQKFFKPPPREFVDVDPEELDDYFQRHNKDYAPYALARVSEDIHYNNIVLPKGYYLIKPGDLSDGSPRINMRTVYGMPVPPPGTTPQTPAEAARARFYNKLDATNAQSPSVTDGLYSSISQRAEQGSAVPVKPQACCQPDGVEASDVTPRLQPMPVPQQDPAQVATDKHVYQVFVIKRLGKVIAVVPVHRMESYWPKRKERVPNQALAWVETEDRHPVLKFYYRHRIYSTDFQ